MHKGIVIIVLLSAITSFCSEKDITIPLSARLSRVMSGMLPFTKNKHKSLEIREQRQAVDKFKRKSTGKIKDYHGEKIVLLQQEETQTEGPLTDSDRLNRIIDLLNIYSPNVVLSQLDDQDLKAVDAVLPSLAPDNDSSSDSDSTNEKDTV